MTSTSTDVIEQESGIVTLLSVKTDPPPTPAGGCYRTNVDILVDADAFAHASGVGLYVGKSNKYGSSDYEVFVEFHFLSKDETHPLRVMFKDGHPGEIVSTTLNVFCWTGTMSSSTGFYIHVKPFVRFDGSDGKTFRVWESRPNYQLYYGGTDFDRTSELLRPSDRPA